MNPFYRSVSIPPGLTRIRPSLLGLLLASLGACASAPSREEMLAGPAPHLTEQAPANITDGQARFRELFCRSLLQFSGEATEPDQCQEWVFRFPNEARPGDYPVPDIPYRGRVLIIPGAFSECFGVGARPFGKAPELLKSDQVEIAIVPIDGRSGTETNARHIAEFIRNWQIGADEPLVIIGYSKGTSDALQFLVDYPDLAANVGAVVSLAGSVRGSPLADRFGGLYDLLFSRLPSGRCERGDRQVVASLKTDVRRAWLDQHQLPSQVRYYSLAAFTDRDRLARSLAPSWRMLLRHGPRNDGQMLPEDTLIPGSTLLGYFYADHWALVMELEQELPILLHRRDPQLFPHTALLNAILQQVAADLSNHP